jgi:hypothetical protein
MVNVVGEDMFMEIDVHAMIKLRHVVFARTYFPATKFQAEETFSAIN